VGSPPSSRALFPSVRGDGLSRDALEHLRSHADDRRDFALAWSASRCCWHRHSCSSYSAYARAPAAGCCARPPRRYVTATEGRSSAIGLYVSSFYISVSVGGVAAAGMLWGAAGWWPVVAMCAAVVAMMGMIVIFLWSAAKLAGR
jgi:hypothetical protein